jgi:hypothetical protein
MKELTRNQHLIKYQKSLRREVKEIFLRYNVNLLFYQKLQQQTNIKKHKRTYNVIKKSLGSAKFDKFLNDLIKLELINHYKYGLAFNFEVSNDFYGYSILLELIMEYDDYLISIELSKKYKVYNGHYINWNKFDIGVNKFETFKYLAKRVNWPELIAKSIRNRTFGNDISKKIVKESIDGIFRRKSATVYHQPGGLAELLDIIAFGMFEDTQLLKHMAYNDNNYVVSEDMMMFIKDYVLHTDSDREERDEKLHKKYATKTFQRKNIHRSEEFYQFIQSKISEDIKLLIALK